MLILEWTPIKYFFDHFAKTAGERFNEEIRRKFDIIKHSPY